MPSTISLRLEHQADPASLSLASLFPPASCLSLPPAPAAICTPSYLHPCCLHPLPLHPRHLHPPPPCRCTLGVCTSCRCTLGYCTPCRCTLGICTPCRLHPRLCTSPCHLHPKRLHPAHLHPCHVHLLSPPPAPQGKCQSRGPDIIQAPSCTLTIPIAGRVLQEVPPLAFSSPQLRAIT